MAVVLLPEEKPVTFADALIRFRMLVASLSTHLGVPLDGSDGMVVLIDRCYTLRMVIELAEDQQGVYAVVPVMPFPEDAGALGELAVDLLLLNADRQALDDAVLCADAHRSLVCLLKRFSIELAPEAFGPALDALADLGLQVANQLCAGSDAATPLSTGQPALMA